MHLMTRILLALSLLSCVNLPPTNEFLRERFSPTARATVHPPGQPLDLWIPYVGQGDATLIRFPNQKTLLIDAGAPPAAQAFILPLLRRLGVSHLDALLITHYDDDHLGGVPALLAGEDGQWGTDDDIQVDVAYDHGGTPLDNSPGLIPYLQALEKQKIPRHILSSGQSLGLDPTVEVRCIASNGTVNDGANSPSQVDLSIPAYAEKENATSIALLLEYNEFRYLTAGDLTGGGIVNGFATPDVETLVAEVVGKVNALHVNHHGSLSSSNARYVAETAPQAVFIQAGVDNPYHHPAPQTVDTWENAGAAIYSTQQGQGYSLTTNGTGFEILEMQR